jgi:hypothetical protein
MREASCAVPAASGELDGSALWRVARVLFEPQAVFTELAATPTAFWAVLVLIVSSLAVQAVLLPRIDFDASVRMAAAQSAAPGPGPSEEALDRAAAAQRKVARLAVCAIPVLVPVVLGVLAAFYFLGLKAVGSEAEYRPVFAALTHALVPPSVVSGVLGCVVGVQRSDWVPGEMDGMLMSSLGAFLDPQTWKPLLVLARAVDVFNIWQWVLLGLGLATVGKVGRGLAAGVVAVLWGLWIAARALWAVAF